MREKLKPCHYCGNLPEIVINQNKLEVIISCKKCGSYTRRSLVDFAIEDWNDFMEVLEHE